MWSAHILRPDGSEKGVSASEDVKKGHFLIPLERKRNPNEPITVKVEYAIAHGKVPLSGALALYAPRSQTHSTFTRWKVKVPHTYAVYATDNGMPADEGRREPGGLPPSSPGSPA